jgi:hypothetical protein
MFAPLVDAVTLTTLTGIKPAAKVAVTVWPPPVSNVKVDCASMYNADSSNAVAEGVIASMFCGRAMSNLFDTACM